MPIRARNFGRHNYHLEENETTVSRDCGDSSKNGCIGCGESNELGCIRSMYSHHNEVHCYCDENYCNGALKKQASIAGILVMLTSNTIFELNFVVN